VSDILKGNKHLIVEEKFMTVPGKSNVDKNNSIILSNSAFED
jgi:hypothetical protein